MNKDQVKDHDKEATGKGEEVVGKTMGDETITLKGQTERALDKTQATHGQAKAPLEKQP